MKKYLLSIFTLSAFSVASYAQQMVLTGAANKHALVEEFTGINCVNCPAGHTELESILTANPGVVHAIAWPPTNSSYTTPSNGGTDFRRSFADAFYTSTYCSPGNGSRFMPSAFVNRKIGGDGNLLQTRNYWANMTTATLTEAAPLNIAVKSTHNATANTLTIDVEVYYLTDVTTSNALMVMLTQDGLTSSYQSGSNATASNPYVYKHTFRENISAGQWGDAITGPTTQGSLYTKQYVFDLSTAIDPINVPEAHIVAFVVDATSSNKEVLNAISISANGGQNSTGSAPTSVNDLTIADNVMVYPNPSNGDMFVNISNKKDAVSLKVLNLIGETIYSEENIQGSATIQQSTFPASGIYFLQLSNGNSKVVRKLIID